MSETFLFLIIIASLTIWISLSKEVSKSSQDFNRPKMLTLLTAGSLSTILLIIVLVQS
ncbi:MULTISPECIES: hypothetical protein [Exiguobacterium]|uniref:hypothetical protein n=1 Tax=Exiguobacterium TaxID=33986 RepID=UPI0013BE93EE|nr:MULTISPECIES: hypothetical protein [Exiguobacterium]MCT4780712.1 hypothetical protein [Exiguobacterium soli]